MKSNKLFVVGVICGTIIVGTLLLMCGYDPTWKMWGIPTMVPFFADARVITGGCESYAAGYDPMVINPGDPWGRTMNYPRVLQLLCTFGIDQSYTMSFGIVLIILFIAGVLLAIPGDMDSLSSCAMLFALFSPAVLLGVERGNYELFIFFLLSFVVWQFAKNSTGYYLSGIAMLFLAFVLKLYPLFGLAVIFRRKSLAIVIGAVTLVLVTAYLLIIRNDLPLIYYGTSKSIYMSYGMDVFPSYVAKYYGENSGTTARFFSYAAVASLCLPVIFGYRTGVPAEVPSVGGDQKRADSFWIGSSIYIGTFIFLGGNYDYRLMFLLLTIPQLVSYSRAATRHVRLTARMVLVSIFVSMWYLKINDIIGLNKVFLLFEELCNWLQFYGLAYLLVGSMSASRRISEIISRMDTSSQCHNQSRNMSSVG